MRSVIHRRAKMRSISLVGRVKRKLLKQIKSSFKTFWPPVVICNIKKCVAFFGKNTAAIGNSVHLLLFKVFLVMGGFIRLFFIR